jgi:hypothetical protein
MKCVTILTTRSKACHVKTLHAILRLNIRCLRKKIDNQIAYVNDDPYEKAEMVQRFIKTYDRIIFFDFGVGVDDMSLDQCLDKHDGVGCLVFPGVREGIDWTLFKQKVREGSKEPVNQMGLHFDTEIDKKISEDIYSVVKTDAKAWMMNTKNVIKHIKDKKTGNLKIYPKMFDKFREQNVRMYAFTAAKLTMSYTHECVSNILNAAGVKVN